MLSVILIFLGMYIAGLVSGGLIIVIYQMMRESYKKYGTLFF